MSRVYTGLLVRAPHGWALKTAPSYWGEEGRKARFHPCVLWPLGGPSTAWPSWMLLSRTWTKLPDGATCAAAWLPFPSAQPCPKSPSSKPPAERAVSGHWARLGQSLSVATGEAEASVGMSSQTGM